MVEINQSICIGCNACVKDCPGSALEMEDKKAVYRKNCIHCGHCVAICPVEAVSIPEYDMDDVEQYNPDTFMIEPSRFLKAVKFRRSIRNYKPLPVEKEKLEHVLDAGRYSATAKNLQDCTFVCIQDNLAEFKELVWKELPSIIDQLKTEHPVYAKVFKYFHSKWEKDQNDDTLFFNSPAFLVVAADNPWDAGLAAANMENMAVAEGLGMLYSGYTQRLIDCSPTLKSWLGTGRKKIACCMLIGYPSVTYRRTAPRKKSHIIWK